MQDNFTPDEVSKRDQTLPLKRIDEEYISNLVREEWRRGNDDRSQYLRRREKYEAAWRDLTTREQPGPWANSANFRSKDILKFGKATHARLWQLFSNPSGFYSVQSRLEDLRDKEIKVKEFMDWIVNDYANSRQGTRREFDKFLWNVVLGGSGYLKCWWKRERTDYTEVVPTPIVEEVLSFGGGDLTGTRTTNVKIVEKDVKKTEFLETPQIKRIVFEDIVMPRGENDPQTASWVSNRIFMTDEDLKAKADFGVFDRDAVQASMAHKESRLHQPDETNAIKENRDIIDGYNNIGFAYDDEYHIVHEWYGKAYVDVGQVDNEKEISEDLSKMPEEIVAWVHEGSGKVLGWTELARISPGGIRPIFKADFITFPDRTDGVGVAELIYEEQRYKEAIINMRMDNGMLASLPMFGYRQASGLKPQVLRVKPGQGVPLDDVNDIRMMQFPFLQGFGYQEEAAIDNKMEGLIAISDINLGIAPDKVGALRNATGSNLLASESGIQLEIHFDRLADTLSKLFQFLFRLCRERVPEGLYYRVNGELGQPLFGKVNRADLKGEYDFKISVDVLGQSQLERQQQSVLMMQTLMNPAFLQTGTVTPSNLYNLGKNFLKSQKVARVDDFVTKPQEYVDNPLTPAERLFRLTIGMIDNPPIESTVQLGENHEAALQAYDQFQKSDIFGHLSPEAVAALHRLQQAHQQLLMAQQAGGQPNVSGMQVPREGMGPLQGPVGAQGSPLQGQGGIPNGPVV